MTILEYDLSTGEMLALVDHRIMTLEGFISQNVAVRDNLLEQGLDMTNLDEYLAVMNSLDLRMQALLQKRNSLEDQG
jgi:hypothetical protein